MSNSSGDIYLVTGGAGFVGSVLVRKLVAQGATVHLLLKSTTDTWRLNDILSQVTIHYLGLENVAKLKKLLAKIQPTIIYHLATRGAYQSQNQPQDIFETNVVGTWNLLQATAEIPYRLFVNTGSSSEYGQIATAMSEANRLQPNSWYAATKAAAGLLALQWAHQAQKPVIHLRLFSVYGPYEAKGRLFPTLLSHLYYQQPLELVAPTVARDFIYVDDVVNLFLDVDQLLKAAGQVLNVGRGQQVTIQEVVDTAFKATGQHVKTAWGEMAGRPWDTTNWQADMSHTFALVNWRPTTSLFDGITRMWMWFPAAADIYKDSDEKGS